MGTWLSEHLSFILIQLVGVCGAACSVSSFQSNRRKFLLIMQIVSCSIWMTHYTLLALVLGESSWTGCVLNVVCATRAAIFYFNDKPWAKSRLWLWFYLALTLGVTFATSPALRAVFTGSGLTFDAVMNFLPALGLGLTTVAFWVKDTRITRVLMLINSPCWMIYNLYSGSYVGFITEVCLTGSVIIAMLRYKGKRNVD